MRRILGACAGAASAASPDRTPPPGPRMRVAPMAPATVFPDRAAQPWRLHLLPALPPLLACLFLIAPETRGDVAVTPGAIGAPGSPGTADTSGTSVTYVFRGTLVDPETTLVGELVVQGDSIACVAEDCPDPPGAAVIRVSRAFVYPGFIDAHNHVAYNFLPRWKPPRNDYPSRYHWQRVKEYGRIKAQYNRVKANVPCDMIKYGEIKALMSGITAIQGTSPASACVEPLIRNVENHLRIPAVGAAYVRTYILDIRGWEGPAPDWSATRSLVLHLGEGRNEASREELGICRRKGLLTAQTAIIHGTAFGEAEFREMAAAGAKLIWSPMSNLALYDSTTDIPLARRAGIPVSLGVDWNLSGSDHVFDELRVAQEVNEEQFGGAIPDSAWLRMITSNPARALALDGYLGRLRPGYKADLVVLRAQDPDPVRSLFKNSLPDVQMVWVGGRVLYGNEAAVLKLRPSGCERLRVKGSRKRVCVSDPSDPSPEAGRTLAEIEAGLRRFCTNPAPLAP